jgi:tripartite-type tricarboxylate transporter receptor subunit TctC
MWMRTGFAITFAWLLSAAAFAQQYPNRPIRFIVASAPGGAPDISSRMLAQEIIRQMGQQVVMDNRPGASGSIGFELIAKAVPDGYTIGFGTFTLATNPAVLPKLRYDAQRDLQMVVYTASTPNLLVVVPTLPVKSVQDLLDHARKYPGKLLFASAGAGSSQHLAGEILMSITGVQLMHVPYKSLDQSMLATITGESQIIFNNMSQVLPHVRAGRVRGLAVTTLKRVSVVPELPTVAESGVPGFEIAPWGGIIAPAGIPRAVLNRLNAEYNTALQSQTVRDFYNSVGVEIHGGTPERFTEHVRKETEKWGALIKRLGIKPAA